MPKTTYKKEIECSRLEIECLFDVEYTDCSLNSILLDQLHHLSEFDYSYFIKDIGRSEDYDSDKLENEFIDGFENISFNNIKDLIKHIEGIFPGHKCHPIQKYEHERIEYWVGDENSSSRFGTSTNGVLITKKKNTEDTVKVFDDAFKFLEKAMNEGIYYYDVTLYDEEGKETDTFTCEELEEIRKMIPEEFKNVDLEDYITIDDRY